MNQKFKEENQVIFSFENLMNDDLIVVDELDLSTCNIKKEVCGVLHSFLSFLKKYENRKSHNMVFLMLSLKAKSYNILICWKGTSSCSC
jgi:hypothetical protein